jgi:hypothetical protein
MKEPLPSANLLPPSALVLKIAPHQPPIQDSSSAKMENASAETHLVAQQLQLINVDVTLPIRSSMMERLQNAFEMLVLFNVLSNGNAQTSHSLTISLNALKDLVFAVNLKDSLVMPPLPLLVLAQRAIQSFTLMARRSVVLHSPQHAKNNGNAINQDTLSL